jgi:hypothetical protein
MTMQAYRCLRIAFVGTLVFAAFVGLVMVGGQFRYSSICDRCGTVRHKSDWQILYSDITVFSQATESDTLLSRVLLTNNIVPTHAHHWLFAQGGGKLVRCAIGGGMYLENATRSEELAALMLQLHRHGLDDINTKILEGCMNPGTSRDFLSFFLVNVPPEPTTSEELRKWFSEQSAECEQWAAIIKR